MSAPLTPEQRETIQLLEESLNGCGLGRGVTLSSVRRWYRIDNPNGMRLLALREACFSAMSALSQPARTCGSCQHWQDLQYVTGPRTGLCLSDHRVNDDTDRLMAANDGCLLGWRARETETTT